MSWNDTKREDADVLATVIAAGSDTPSMRKAIRYASTDQVVRALNGKDPETQRAGIEALVFRMNTRNAAKAGKVVAKMTPAEYANLQTYLAEHSAPTTPVTA